MDGSTLFELLLAKRGMNPNALAAAIRRPTAQSGFDRFKKGLIKQPKRSEALELAAQHLGVDVLAFYDEVLADKEWARIEGRISEAHPAPSILATSARPGGLEIRSLEQSFTDDLTIPEYDAAGRMGSGGLVLKDQPGVIHSWNVSPEWVQKNVRSHTGVQNLCIVTGFGDSMKGMFNPGDPLLVDKGVTTVDLDAVYFFRVEEEGFIKRLQRIPGEGIRVISANKEYENWTIKKGMEFQVLARVLRVWEGTDL